MLIAKDTGTRYCGRATITSQHSGYQQMPRSAMWEPACHKGILMSSAKATSRISETQNQNCSGVWAQRQDGRRGGRAQLYLQVFARKHKYGKKLHTLKLETATKLHSPSLLLLHELQAESEKQLRRYHC